MRVIERMARALAFSHGSKIVSPGQSVATREVGWSGDGEYLDRYVAAHWKEHVHAAKFALDALSGGLEDLPLWVLLAGKNSLFSCAEDPEIDDARKCFVAMVSSLVAEGEFVEPPFATS